MKKAIVVTLALLLGLLMCFTGCSPADSPAVDTGSGAADASGSTGKPAGDATPEGTRPPARENVAKIILLMGQSNAIGATEYTPLKKILGNEAYKRAVSGYENVRIVYYAGESSATNYNAKKIDTTTVSALFDKVRFGKTLYGTHFGPDVGMAEAFSQQYPDDELFIIKVGRGGTSLSPYFMEGGALLEKAVQIVDGCCSVLEREGYSPEIISICWMQGENEAQNISNADNYKNELAVLVPLLREKFSKYAPYGGIPFIDAGISSHWTYHEKVNGNKKAYADESDLNYYFSTIDLGFTFNKEPEAKPDLAHFDSESVWLLGQEFLKDALAAYDKVR